MGTDGVLCSILKEGGERLRVANLDDAILSAAPFQVGKKDLLKVLSAGGLGDTDDAWLVRLPLLCACLLSLGENVS